MRKIVFLMSMLLVVTVATKAQEVITSVVGGNNATHMLCCKFQAHFMLDDLAYFVKRVFSKARVKLRCGIHCKIPERIAWEEIS